MVHSYVGMGVRVVAVFEHRGAGAWRLLAVAALALQISSCASILAPIEGRRVRFESCSAPIARPLAEVAEAASRACYRLSPEAQAETQSDGFTASVPGKRVHGKALPDGTVKLVYQGYDVSQSRWSETWDDELACAVLAELDPVKAKDAKSKGDRFEKAVLVGEVPPEPKYFGKRAAIVSDGLVDFLLAADFGFRFTGAGLFGLCGRILRRCVH